MRPGAARDRVAFVLIAGAGLRRSVLSVSVGKRRHR